MEIQKHGLAQQQRHSRAHHQRQGSQDEILAALFHGLSKQQTH